MRAHEYTVWFDIVIVDKTQSLGVVRVYGHDTHKSHLT